jgi:hypothetical protein
MVTKIGGGCAAEPRGWELCLEELDREELEGFGKILDQRPARLRGRTVGMALGEKLLRVRTRAGKTARLRATGVQRAFEMRRGDRRRHLWRWLRRTRLSLRPARS